MTLYNKHPPRIDSFMGDNKSPTGLLRPCHNKEPSTLAVQEILQVGRPGKLYRHFYRPMQRSAKGRPRDQRTVTLRSY